MVISTLRPATDCGERPGAPMVTTALERMPTGTLGFDGGQEVYDYNSRHKLISLIRQLLWSLLRHLHGSLRLLWNRNCQHERLAERPQCTITTSPNMVAWWLSLCYVRTPSSSTTTSTPTASLCSYRGVGVMMNLIMLMISTGCLVSCSQYFY